MNEKGEQLGSFIKKSICKSEMDKSSFGQCSDHFRIRFLRASQLMGSVIMDSLFIANTTDISNNERANCPLETKRGAEALKFTISKNSKVDSLVLVLHR